MTTLYIYSNQGESRKLSLEKDAVTLGRAKDNDVTLADPSCSSRHAVIERAGEGFVIRDAGSKNGTIVNGRRIDGPVALAAGDEIVLGSTSVTLERPRMPRVTMIDAPGTEADASAVIPYRQILDKTSATDAATSRHAAPADLAEENRILQVRSPREDRKDPRPPLPPKATLEVTPPPGKEGQSPLGTVPGPTIRGN